MYNQATTLGRCRVDYIDLVKAETTIPIVAHVWTVCMLVNTESGILTILSILTISSILIILTILRATQATWGWGLDL